MKLKLLFLILLFSFPVIITAQVKEKYTKTELTTFLKIYKHTLDHPFDITSSMQKNAKSIKIPEERLGEILQAQFAGNSLKLTEAENKEMTTLKKLMEVDQESYNKALEKYILDNKMTNNKYKEIVAEYYSSQKFQKKVNKLNIK